MKLIRTIVIVFLLAPSILAQSYQIDWYVIGSGGGHSQSANYQLDGTIGQPIVGSSSSANFIIEGGYWAGYAPGPSGYQYLPGDVNMHVGLWPPQAIGADITYIVNYLRNNPVNVPCLLDGVWASADVNGSCTVDGSDVIRFVNYLRGIIGLTWCPGYDPAWPTPQDVPAEQPQGWPGCETATGGRVGQ